MIQVSCMGKEDEEEDNSSASSKASSTSQALKKKHLQSDSYYQDAQDPFNGSMWNPYLLHSEKWLGSACLFQYIYSRFCRSKLKVELLLKLRILKF